MAVSKRLRYEVFKRDAHTCRYCGGTAPNVQLTVDHVVPVALGGGDQPDNLVTACADRNAGKSSVPADAPLVEGVADRQIQWGKAMEEAARIQAQDSDEARRATALFLEEWSYLTDPQLLPGDWEESIERLRQAGLEAETIRDQIKYAVNKGYLAYNKMFAYTCGICWRIIRERQEIARSLIATEEDE